MISPSFLKFGLMYGVRSLARNRRRSVLLLATVALAVMTSVIAKSYADAVFKFWVTSTTETGTGQAQIHKVGYWTEATGLERRFCFKEGDPIESRLTQDSNVEGFSRRLVVDGLISAGAKSIYFSGYGIAPSEESIVSPRLASFEGSVGDFLDGQNEAGIVVGQGMAQTLGIEIGDVVTLSVQTVPDSGQGSINGKDVVIAGIIDYPQKMISKRIIYMNLTSAQKLMHLENHYSEIAIRTRSGVDLAAWIADKESGIHALGAELRPWWQIFPPMQKVERIFRQVVGVICILLFLAAGISVLNIVYLTVTERTVELGILMSMGAKGKLIKQMLALEAMTIGVAGGFLGLFCGNIIITVMNGFGMPLPNPLFRGMVYIRPVIDWAFCVLVFLIGIAICYISTIIPAIRASKVEPVVAFKGQI